ncbi:MAG TPA: hypothetical protein PLD88_00515, partial [Candidatus Berkiella sp.]|nr:hypothetical protein [Candidatus Berkiella sp.]
MQARKLIQAATIVVLSSFMGACCNRGCVQPVATVVEKEKNLAVMKSSTYYFAFDKADLLDVAK